MLHPFRSALLVIAALNAASVAPAQVHPAAEQQITARPTGEQLIQVGTNQMPATVVPAVLPTTEFTPELPGTADPLGPQADEPVAEPETTRPSGDLASMVAQLRGTDPGSRELECLAGAIYFESKSESLKGQLAVGHVIANRASSGRFPSTYCGVVYQRSQFSFVRGRSMPPIARSSLQWKNAVAIARIVDQKLQPTPVSKALFFHARRVSPGWRLTRVATLGNHVFYR